MEKYIGPEWMFHLKKGMKIRLPDGRMVELLSNYRADGLKYECIEDGETKELSCLEFIAGHIITE